MSRNVVRSIRRPCVTTQSRPSTIHHAAKRWYSEMEEIEDTEPTKSILDNPEEATLLLRKLDQKHLSQARKNTEEVIRMVEDAKVKVAALPTTVQILPEIPPYTMAKSRQLYQRYFPETADQTIAAAKHVREHLIDLKYKPYEDSDDSALVKEIAALSEDEKRERYTEKKNEAKAMEVRLRRQTEEDVKKVRETIERHKTLKGAPMPEFDTKPPVDSEAESQAFKDLAEPFATEGKKSEAWSRPKRKSEVQAVDGAGWYDAERKPIRRFLTRDPWKNEDDDRAAADVETESSQTHEEVKEDSGSSQAAKISSNEAKEGAPAAVSENEGVQETNDNPTDSGYIPFGVHDAKENEQSAGKKATAQSEKGQSPTFESLKSQLEAKVSGNRK